MPDNNLDPTLWVDRYSDYLFNYTITRVNDREVAQDLISETFLAGLKAMHNFKGQAAERTWLIAILKRKIIDHYRKTNSQKGKAEIHMNYRDNENEGDWLEEQVADVSDKSVEDQIENEELGFAIFKCLDTLPERQRSIFIKKTIDNFETEVICNEYGITPSNFWVIIHRARTAMASCMEHAWL